MACCQDGHDGTHQSGDHGRVTCQTDAIFSTNNLHSNERSRTHEGPLDVRNGSAVRVRPHRTLLRLYIYQVGCDTPAIVKSADHRGRADGLSEKEGCSACVAGWDINALAPCLRKRCLFVASIVRWWQLTPPLTMPILRLRTRTGGRAAEGTGLLNRRTS